MSDFHSSFDPLDSHESADTFEFRHLDEERSVVRGFNVLSALDSGYRLDDTSVNVYFGPKSFSSGEGVRSEGFNSYEKARFETAFKAIEAVANISFDVVTSAAKADFKLVLDTNEGHEYSNALGYFYLPTGGSLSGTGVFNGKAWDRSSGGDLETGGYGFVTVLHELLHGAGLSHLHDTSGASQIMPGITSSFNDTGDALLNQGVYSAMSYNAGFLEGPVGTRGHARLKWGFEGTPMALDIAALQDLYGARSYNTSSSTYVLPGSNKSGTHWAAIWDTGGSDLIRYDGNRDAHIDLRAATLLHEKGGGGFISAADGIAGGFTIAHGVTIERALGGTGSDTIIGNAANNVLNGRGGNDVIRGGDGADNITGGSGADRLWGGDGNDQLKGNTGNDFVDGGDGNDYIALGSGRDRASGGGGNDTLRGNGGRDVLTGGDGNDLLKGGSKSDTLAGGSGADRLYGNSGSDRLKGEDGNDYLAGNRGNDRLNGGSGADKLNGGSGRDVLRGSRDDDTLTGGGGSDRFVFAAGDGHDRITDFSSGRDRLKLSRDLTDGLSDDRAILKRFADKTDDGLKLTFSDDQSILLIDIDNVSALVGDIYLF